MASSPRAKRAEVFGGSFDGVEVLKLDEFAAFVRRKSFSGFFSRMDA